MRKALILVLILSILLVPVCSLAAGKATVTKETFFVLPFLDYHSGVVMAEVTNTGDKTVVFNGGLVELYNSDGDSIESENLYSCYPSVLGPGESGYLSTEIGVDEATDKSYIDDYLLTVTGKGENEKETVRLQCEGSFGEYKRSEYWTEYGVAAMVTNDTDELLRSIRVVYALFDAEDNLLGVAGAEPSYVGLPSGQTMEVRTSIDDDWVEQWATQGAEPARIEVIAYVEKDL
ncbi:FxLYD domain-containing protein [Eubacteriales bacterium OttesenSCG-928-A19]|nr:FxLYD domain-containing protein [Eubacteriales bacterium OttesenSCG-928-A19]